MKVFVFCIAILLATAVDSSPIEVDVDGIVNNEVADGVEPEFEPIQMFNDDDEKVEELVTNEPENEIEDSAVIIEDEVGVPYEEKTLESEDSGAFQDNDDSEDAEEEERKSGLDIPLCAQYHDNRVALHLSHLTDCTKFYKCYLGRGFLMDCPSHEHWSVKLNRCDYPEIANCQPDGTHQYKIKRTKPMQASEQKDDDEKQELGDFEIDPRCEGSDPFKPLQLRHPNDCTKFYKCYMGKAYVIKCPKGQQWAQHLNRCEHASVARCIIKQAIKPAQAMEEYSAEDSDEDDEHTIVDDPDYKILDPRCAPDEDDIYHPIQFAHPTDCNMFYKCFDHKAYKSQCPFGLHFNEKDQNCDYPSEANCLVKFSAASFVAAEDSESMEEEEHTIVDDPDYKVLDPRCAPDEDDIYHPIQFAHPTDCNMFYKCFDHKAYKSQCPFGLHFNEKDQNCDYASRANCLVKYTIFADKASVSHIQAEHTLADDPDYKVLDPRCAPDDDDIYHPIQFAHPTNCNMFYKCTYHKAIKSQCPFGLHFNEKNQNCDYPMNSDCKARFSADSVSVTQANADFPSIPHCPKGKANLPVEGMFNVYFECNEGLAYLMECDNGEIFNPIKSKCEHFVMPQYPAFPDMMNQFPGMMGQFPGMMGQFPGMMNQHPGFPQFQYPGGVPQMPQMPQKPQIPLAPQSPMIPETPSIRPPTQVKPNPNFPSWMPVPNQNIPSFEMPQVNDKPSAGDKKNDFNYSNGKANSRCPSSDEPTKPTHLSHDTECNKFFKCFNGRAFLMTCPESQEWSETLQRCDFHEFANCDPIELIKKKIQN